MNEMPKMIDPQRIVALEQRATAQALDNNKALGRIAALKDRVIALEDKIEAKQSAYVPLNELGKRVSDLEAAQANQRAVNEAWLTCLQKMIPLGTSEHRLLDTLRESLK